jgi:CRISPR-associated protein Cmr1
MKPLTAHLEILTPCFCAGGEQEHAELRAPSVRGQLRWWFRLLGGTPETEKRLFGGVHKLSGETNDQATAASKVTIRIRNQKLAENRPSLPSRAAERLFYLLYFAKASSDGRRYFSKDGFLSPESTFDLEAVPRLTLTSDEESAFLRAWNAFLLLGSLGLRQTRGCGAFQCTPPPTLAEVQTELRTLANFGIRSWVLTNRHDLILTTNSWKESLGWLEAALGHLRQNGLSAGQYGNNPTPLGTSSKPRQASALHLRPLLTSDKGLLSILFYTPAILGSQSQRGGNKLLDILDHHPPIKFPYRQKMPSSTEVDTRDEISARPLL